jgi:hypothetical protein
MDIGFRNQPAGFTFPADEILSGTTNIARNMADAMMNDPDANYAEIAGRGVLDFLKNNIQVARIGIQQAAEHGIGTKDEIFKKQLNDKLNNLRRWKMVEGMPYEPQAGGVEGNPYMNLSQKQYKHEEDIQAAIKEAGPLIQNIVKHYGNNPDVMFEKFKALKQNAYETMPSLDDTPLTFVRYIQFLKATRGDQAATAEMQDFLRHKMINEIKSSVIP